MAHLDPSPSRPILLAARVVWKAPKAFFNGVRIVRGANADFRSTSAVIFTASDEGEQSEINVSRLLQRGDESAHTERTG